MECFFYNFNIKINKTKGKDTVCKIYFIDLKIVGLEEIWVCISIFKKSFPGGARLKVFCHLEYIIFLKVYVCQACINYY